jgi:hypothetical protein
MKRLKILRMKKRVACALAIFAMLALETTTHGRLAANRLAANRLSLFDPSFTALADSPPTVMSQPETVMLAGSSDSGSFTATADGFPLPTVQWQYSTDRRGPWTNISGATSTTLNLTPVPYPNYIFSLGNAFRAVFTNAAGTAVSRPAKLVWRTEWMRDLGSDIAGVPLNQLTIPGTHDMGTYGITNDSDDSRDGQASNTGCSIDHDACLRWAEAQNPSKNAGAELDQGIRYFDLRVCGHSGGIFVTCHGLNAARLDEILNQTREWINSHPYDVVFLDFNHHFELDVEAEAAQIEQAFALPDGGSLLIPPQYCTPGDNASGTCADSLSLGSIEARNLGRVIVNFENDDAANSQVYLPSVLGSCPDGLLGPDSFGRCYFYRQPLFGLDFYNNHPLFWGRAAAQPTSFSFSGESCTTGGAVLSCFGNDSDASTVLNRITHGLTNIGDSHRFYVQFLQTTPDSGYIASNFGSSLDQMAHASNPIIGPALFGCDSSNPNCFFSEARPENLNILPINFYNDIDYKIFHSISPETADACTGGSSSCPLTTPEVQTIECFDAGGFAICTYYDPVHFDYVEEVIRFDEYARTAPVVRMTAPISPAATGWFNAAVLGGQGKKLELNANANDYRYPTGISRFEYQDNFGSVVPLTPGTNAPFVNGHIDLSDGYHLLTYSAADGATFGHNGYGNSGGGPGSTGQPVSFNVDTVPPTITCQTPVFILHQPAATVGATVTDATSGPLVSSLSAAVSTNAVGTFSVSFTAYDVAGNSTTGSCSYTVTYGIALLYDPRMLWTSGNTVPIRISLVDYFGNNLSAKSIPVSSVTVTNTGTNAVVAPTASGNANANFLFTASPKGYVYTLATRGYASGSYTLDFMAAGDPVMHHGPFLIR